MASGADVLTGVQAPSNPSATSGYKAWDEKNSVAVPRYDIQDWLQGTWDRRVANYEADKEAATGQKLLNLATWEREDNATQRWVEDVKKAGLNPYWLSNSGSLSAAGATALTSSKASKQDEKTGFNASDILTRILSVVLLGAFGLASAGIKASATTGAAALKTSATQTTYARDSRGRLIYTYRRHG